MKNVALTVCIPLNYLISYFIFNKRIWIDYLSSDIKNNYLNKLATSEVSIDSANLAINELIVSFLLTNNLTRV